MATAKPSTRVAVVSLGGHWQYGDFVKKGVLTYMAKREAKEAIAAKVVRPATEAEIQKAGTTAKGKADDSKATTTTSTDGDAEKLAAAKETTKAAK